MHILAQKKKVKISLFLTDLRLEIELEKGKILSWNLATIYWRPSITSQIRSKNQRVVLNSLLVSSVYLQMLVKTANNNNKS